MATSTRDLTKEKILKRIKKTDTGCWEWQGATIKRGYGKIREGHKFLLVHRVMYGDIPKGMCVLHTCDNPPCCNPDHLFVGTRKDNALDAVSKGRNFVLYGVASPRAKLTPEIVRKIRSSKEPVRVLAERYNVTPKAIYHVLRRETWKHVE